MIRKLFLASLVTLFAVVARGQDDYGLWTLHPIFSGDNITSCIDTGDKVFYLASNNLFCYDKETQENEHLSRTNYLNDTGVSSIYYNPTKKYIIVAYVNSNIDVIDVGSGKVYNISDIKESDITTSKAINDITFANGNRAVVATDFGFLILDDNKLEVVSSLIGDDAVASAMILGDFLVVNLNGKLRYAPVDKHLQMMSDLTGSQSVASGTMVPIDDSHFFLLASKALYLVTATANSETLSFSPTKLVDGKPVEVAQTHDGDFLASFKDADYYYTIDATTFAATRHDGVGIYSSMENDGSLWVLTADGLTHVKDGESSLPIKPSAISLSTIPYWMTYDVANKQLYLTSTSDNVILVDANLTGKTQINTYDGVTWTDVTPDDIPQPDEGSYWPVISPNEENTYYFSTRKLGIVKVTNGKIVDRYTNASCGIVDRMAGLRFDSQGNLWIVETRDKEHPVRVLTPAKQIKGNITAQDFIYNTSSFIKNLNHDGFKRTQFVVGAGDTKVFTSGQYQSAVVMWNNNSDLSLANSISFTSGALVDQDGKSLDWYENRCLAVDNNGLVWMGTTTGVICFNPSKAFDADFCANHIKVPRNDGTNLADYLLDGQTINCIGVDGANRKWIGTDASGLFLVSADGQTVLKNFNANNSVMGSNQIYQICCDPTSNSVFVTTPLGMAEYKSDATPGESSYSNIYAYPNPVRPDYGGPINITGLMENSLVKIADPSGNVIRSLKSTGGMVSWDGCNYNGELVPTGVYTILASQADGSSGATTKVLIVR